MQMSSASETKGSVYNARRNFSASNVVKKSAHYTRVNTVTAWPHTPPVFTKNHMTIS